MNLKAPLGGLCLVLLSATAHAETVGVKWVDSQFSGETATSAERGAEAGLAEQSALTLREVPGNVKRGCAQDKGCVARLAESAEVDHLLLLRGRQMGGRLWVDGVWWESQSRTLRVHLERDIPDAGASARSVVQALIPVYARRGYAGLTVQAPSGVVVKVDGRRMGTTPLDAPLVVPAGAHSVDLIDPDGRSVLTNEAFAEGQRLPLSLAASPFDPSGTRRGSETLLWTSYGLWSAGALAIAGAFVAGTVARRAGGDLRACSETSRDCTSAEDARLLSERVDRNAQRANILLGLGGALTVAGTGLFAWTWFGQGPRDDAPRASAGGKP